MSVIVSNFNSNLGIQIAYEPGFQQLVWRNNSLLPLFGPAVDTGGGEYIYWHANTSGNSSVEIYSEDQALPAAGNQTYVSLYQAPMAFRFVTRVTGHARAALRKQWFAVIEEEQTLGNADMVDLMTTSFMGSTYGLEAHIAATGAYGGVTRGSSTYIESAVTTVSREVQLTDIMDMVETLSDNDRGQRPNMLLGAVNQQTRMYQFAAPGGMKVQQAGSDPTPGFNPYAMDICGMAGHFLPDWTDATICLLRKEHVVFYEHQPYQIHDQNRSGDSDVLQTSWMGLLLHKFPMFAGKLASCTA